MANSLSLLCRITENSAANGTLQRQMSATDTPVGSLNDIRRISVGTAEETHVISTEITGGSNKPGWCVIQNRDTTNYVQIGIATTAYFARLEAGKSMLLQLENTVTTFYLKAHTAAVEMEIAVWER